MYVIDAEYVPLKVKNPLPGSIHGFAKCAFVPLVSKFNR
jgi:hypothetical protein